GATRSNACCMDVGRDDSLAEGVVVADVSAGGALGAVSVVVLSATAVFVSSMSHPRVRRLVTRSVGRVECVPIPETPSTKEKRPVVCHRWQSDKALGSLCSLSFVTRSSLRGSAGQPRRTVANR